MGQQGVEGVAGRQQGRGRRWGLPLSGWSTPASLHSGTGILGASDCMAFCSLLLFCPSPIREWNPRRERPCGVLLSAALSVHLQSGTGILGASGRVAFALCCSLCASPSFSLSRTPATRTLQSLHLLLFFFCCCYFFSLPPFMSAISTHLQETEIERRVRNHSTKYQLVGNGAVETHD